MGCWGLSSWAFIRLLLLGCWALSLLHLLLNSWTWPRTTGDPRQQPPPYTVLTIHQGYQAPQALGKERRGSGLGAGQHYQDENEQHLAHSQLHCAVVLSQALPRGHLDGAEGAWAVCLDHMTTISLKQQQEKCLVYTFSVVKRTTDFAEKMSDVGCEVHSFGLTPQKEDDPGHKNQRIVHHPRLWLDWREHRLITSLQGQKSSSKKLQQILQELGHMKIDVLEADLASAEWKILESTLLDGTLEAVHQLILTIHVHWPGFEVAGNETAVVRYWYSLLKDLETRGFLLFHSYQNPDRPQLFLHKSHFNTSSSYTLGWVNTRWMF
ncbi:methyltransferase-like protein 24 isoform X2 [Microcaecilia unicolor]|uniref:Methyltransferase-like protein 24 isoform X2 n=1 Tax=Microcaecilia unicolor TaxID=1415580 RepID=A0A6P7Z7U6_9AMPH|nr:methyltransferase-like protein 24 isoform X2 [Microcaecilia unicolor]